MISTRIKFIDEPDGFLLLRPVEHVRIPKTPPRWPPCLRTPAPTSVIDWTTRWDRIVQRTLFETVRSESIRVWAHETSGVVAAQDSRVNERTVIPIISKISLCKASYQLAQWHLQSKLVPYLKMYLVGQTRNWNSVSTSRMQSECYKQKLLRNKNQ